MIRTIKAWDQTSRAARSEYGGRAAFFRLPADLRNFSVSGGRKVWRQLRREGFAVARCTVERPMDEWGLQGVIPGKAVRTTVSDKAAPCPLDHVNRHLIFPRFRGHGV